MEKIASILKVAPEVIENMEETPISVVIENNNFENGSINSGIGYAGEFNDQKKIFTLLKRLSNYLKRMHPYTNV